MKYILDAKAFVGGEAFEPPRNIIVTGGCRRGALLIEVGSI
jgi:hypothetical protein